MRLQPIVSEIGGAAVLADQNTGHYAPINCMPHLPLLGQYLGHTWRFDHESHPEGAAFDHMIIRCYSAYIWWGQHGRFDLNMWPQGGALN